MPELLGRLDEGLRQSDRSAVLAFDADGTLWEGDVTRDLVSWAMSERPLLPDCLPALHALAAEHGLPIVDDPHAQLGTALGAYSKGRLPELRAIECVTYAFAGHDRASFERIVELSTERAQLATRFRATMRELFDWAATNRVPVHVVSASPRTAVEHALRTLGLAAAAVAGTELRTVGSRFIADLAGEVPYGSAKVDALRGLCGGASVVGAFGDDVRDRELLALGRIAVAVCPSAELRACGTEIPHLCELDLYD